MNLGKEVQDTGGHGGPPLQKNSRSNKGRSSIAALRGRPVVVLVIVVLTTVGVCGQESKGPSSKIDVAVPKLTYCQLIKHPEKYDDRVVEVTGIFERRFEVSYLYDEEGCQKDLRKSETWVTHYESFVTDGISEEARINNEVSGFGTWSLTAIGRFQRAKGKQKFGHLGCCRYQFAFMKIVQSQKL